MTIEKIVIPPALLPAINVNAVSPQHVVRFRIRSNDLNKSSDWTPLQKLKIKSMGATRDAAKVGPLTMECSVLESNPYRFQIWWGGGKAVAGLTYVSESTIVNGVDVINFIRVQLDRPEDFRIGDEIFINQIQDYSENGNGIFRVVGEDLGSNAIYIKPVKALEAPLSNILIEGVPRYSSIDVYYVWSSAKEDGTYNYISTYYAGTFGSTGTFITESLIKVDPPTVVPPAPPIVYADPVLDVLFQRAANPKFKPVESLIFSQRSITI